MILVTGSEGFIGSHVVEALRRDGETVLGLDLKPKRERDYVQCDIRDADKLSGVLCYTMPKAVIHLAARVGVRDSLLDPRGYLETNVIGTQNLLDACQKAGVKQVVLASTSSVYGHLQEHGGGGGMRETDLTCPLSPYAASKVGMEAIARVYHELYGMNIAVLRLFSVYGERIRPDLMIYRIMDSITTGEKITVYEFRGAVQHGFLSRDWTYVGDAVQGIRAALNVKGYEIFNIGRGSPSSLMGWVTELEKVSGGLANVVVADAPLTEPRSTYAEIGKAKRLLGFAPQVDFQEGLRRTWAWFETAHALGELEPQKNQEQAGEFRKYGNDWVTRRDVQTIVLEEISRLDE